MDDEGKIKARYNLFYKRCYIFAYTAIGSFSYLPLVAPMQESYIPMSNEVSKSVEWALIKKWHTESMIFLDERRD